MKIILMRTGLLLLFFVLIFLVGLGIALRTLTPETYKSQLASLFEETTGHAIHFDGELQPTFFPAPGLKTGRIRIEDSPLFGGGPLLQVEHTNLRLALLPLLRGQVVIEALHIANVQAKLVETAEGEQNWMGLQQKEALLEARQEEGVQVLTPAATITAPTTQPATQPSKESSRSRLNLQIRQVLCSNATIRYENRANSTQLQAGLDTVRLENSASALPARLTANGYIENTRSGAGAEFALKSTAALTLQGLWQLQLEELALQAGKGLAAADASPGFGASVTGTFEANLEKRSVHMPRLNGTIAGAPFTGEGEFLLPGNPELAENARFGMQAALHLDTLNLDSLQAALTPPLSPARQVEEIFPATPPPAPTPPLGRKGKKTVKTAPVALPRLSGHAVVSINKLVVQGLSLTGLNAVMEMTPEQITCAPVSFGLAEGKVEGSVSVTSTSTVPHWEVHTTMQGLRLQELLHTLGGNAPVDGKLHGSADLTADGTAAENMLPTLGGKTAVALHGGTVETANLLPTELIRMGSLPNVIPLAKAGAEATIAKGIVKVERLEARAQVATVTGNGTLQLLQKTLALQLEATLLEGTLRVPVTLAGPWAAPLVRLGGSGVAGVGKLVNDVITAPKSTTKKLEKEAKNILKDLGIRKR